MAITATGNDGAL